MNLHEILHRIISELKGAWRFRWLAMALAWAICLVGWATVYTIPDTYESEALIYIDTTSALQPLLDDMMIKNDVRRRVDLVTTAMLGRPQLEAVARKTGMDARAKTERELEDLLLGMYRRTKIDNRAGHAQSVYTITYKDQNPQMAQTVVSTMLKTFVEDTMGENKLDTENAQEFIRNQLAQLENELTASEQRLAEFKKAHVGRMPGEGGGYFKRLQTEMDLRDETRSDLQLATRRKEALRRQLAGESPSMTSGSPEGGAQTELDQRIAANQSRLEELQLRFTDQHPDVISIKETLVQLREQKRRELEQLRRMGGNGAIASDNPVYQNIQIELTNVNVEIAALQEKLDAHNRRISELQELVDVIPEVEAELVRLTRDYDVKQRQYQNLLGRLNVAELSQEADRSEDVQFRIIEPPTMPREPVEPNRPLLLAAVLVFALGAGGGGAYLVNLLKPIFTDSKRLRAVTGFPVLASVAVLRTADRRHMRMMEVGALSAALLALCAMFGVVFLFQQSIIGLIQQLL